MRIYPKRQRTRVDPRGTHVYGYKFEEAILGEYRHDDFMPGLRINVQEWNTASVCLNQEFGRVEECGGGMFSEEWWRSDAELLFNIWIDMRVIDKKEGGRRANL